VEIVNGHYFVTNIVYITRMSEMGTISSFSN